MGQEITYIGMDLGTFKTSIACSNGRRAVVQSAVGWPKDLLARSVIGRDVAFGDELRERRLALDVVRPFAGGILKYGDATAPALTREQIARHKEAARLLVAHAVSLVSTESEGPIRGIIGAPSRASLGNKEVILEAARDVLDAIAIVPEPFAAAYGMQRIVDTLVVDIGAGTIDICPLHGAFPTEESQVTVGLGGDSIDAELAQRIMAQYPTARLSANMLRDLKEKYGFVDDPQQRVEVELPILGRPQRLDLTEPLRGACQSIVAPLVEGIGEVLANYDPEFQETLRSNVLLAGGGSQIRGLDRLLERALDEFGGGQVRKVYDHVFAGATGALKLGMDMPTEYWDRLTLGRKAPTAA